MSHIADLIIELDQLREALDQEITHGDSMSTVQKIYFAIKETEGLVAMWQLTKNAFYN